jgi:hypothetical protein
MKSTKAIEVSRSALQRLLDPLHPDGHGEARRQLRRLTADEREELHQALVVLNLMIVGLNYAEPTEIDRTPGIHAMPKNIRW